MADLTSIIANLGQNVNPLEKLVSGFSYLLGFMFVWLGLKKLRDIADARAQSGGGKSTFVPTAYIIGGSALFFLPTMYDVAMNTLWGSGSPIAYAPWVEQYIKNSGTTPQAMTRILQLAGLIWFIRGIVLLVQSTHPGNQFGKKGLAFAVAGVLALNIEHTVMMMSNGLDYIMANWFK